MKFAVVELKYKPGKTLVVPINWIKKFNIKYKQTDAFLCFISMDRSDEPNFDVGYEKDFNGSAGTFKIYVLKVTDSIEDTIIYQREKRLKSLPKKFREPENKEAEISAEQKRKRRSQKKIQTSNKRVAMVKNISYLSNTIFNVPSDEKASDNDKSGVDSSLSDANLTAEGFSPATVSSLSNSNGSGEEGDDVVQSDVPKQQVVVLTENRKPDDFTIDGRECIVEDSPCTLNSEALLDGSCVGLSSIISNINGSGEEGDDVVQSDVPKQQVVVLTKNRKPDDFTIDGRECIVEDSPCTLNAEALLDESCVASSSIISDAYSNALASPKKLKTPRKPATKQQQNAIDLDSYTAPKAVPQLRPINAVEHEADVPADPEETIHNLDYDELMRALNQNIYVIPADQNFSGIAGSFANGTFLEPFSANVVDVTRTSGQQRPNEFEMQQKAAPQTTLLPPPSHQTLSEGGLSYDDLMRENTSLREQIGHLSERNVALQDALVSTNKIVPPVAYESKDRGRLYNGSIFLNATQCEILDKTEDTQKFLNNLALAVFGSQTLRNSSVTGSVSNNFKKPAKPALDKERLNLIYSLMVAKTNCRCFDRSRINQILNKKIYNLNASGKPRKNHSKNDSDVENQIIKSKKTIALLICKIIK